MAAPMPAQSAGAPEPQGNPEAESNESITQVIEKVGAGLMALIEMIQGAQGVDPAVKEKAAALGQGFMDMIQGLLNGSGSPQPKPKGQVPFGASGDMEAGGNPNARPI